MAPEKGASPPAPPKSLITWIGYRRPNRLTIAPLPPRQGMNGVVTLLLFDTFESFDFGFPMGDVGGQFRALASGQWADLFAPPKLYLGLLQIELRPPQVRLFDEAEQLMPAQALFVSDVVFAGESLIAQFMKFV